MARHCPAIMRDQHTALLGCECQYSKIIQAGKIGSVCCLEVNLGIQSKDSSDDKLIQISISLKPNFHYEANCSSRRALANFRENPGSRTVR